MWKKLLKFDKGNANQNYLEHPSYPSQNGHLKKIAVNVEEKKTHIPLVGAPISIAAMEDSMQILQTKNRRTIWSSYSASG